MTQAFVSPRGERKLLLINKRQREPEINLAGPDGSKIKTIDLATGSSPTVTKWVTGSNLKLGRFGVAAVTLVKAKD